MDMDFDSNPPQYCYTNPEPRMYALHNRRHYWTPNDFAVIGKNFPTLEAAARARLVSGDLVVWQDTGKVVNDESWLFGWETRNDDCHARKAMRHDNPT